MFGSTSVLGWTIPEGWRFARQGTCPDCEARIAWLFQHGPVGEVTVAAYDAIGHAHADSCPNPVRVVEQATIYAERPDALRYGSPSRNP